MQPSSRCLQLRRARFSRLNNDVLVLETDLFLSAIEFIYGSRVRYQKEIDRLALAMDTIPSRPPPPIQWRMSEPEGVSFTFNVEFAPGSGWLPHNLLWPAANRVGSKDHALGMYRGRIISMGRDCRPVEATDSSPPRRPSPVACLYLLAKRLAKRQRKQWGQCRCFPASFLATSNSQPPVIRECSRALP